MSEPIDIESVLQSILAEKASMFSAIIPGHPEALDDARTFLLQSKNDITVFYSMFASKEIDQDELESLVKGLVDLGELHKLKESGLEAVQIDKLKQELVNLVVTAVGETVKIGTRATV